MGGCQEVHQKMILRRKSGSGGAAGKEESSRKGRCWSAPCYGHYLGPPKDPKTEDLSFESLKQNNRES